MIFMAALAECDRFLGGSFFEVNAGFFGPFGSVAEHSLGKGEVPGPIPGMGTIF
jgi:hypothetical protein